MSSLKDLASLIMIPSLVKDGRLDTVKPLGNSIIHPDATGNNDGTDGSTPAEGNFTFTRGSNLSATRVNASQLIEKGRENLILQSNQFDNAYWTKSASTITTGQADPNRASNAFKIVEDTSTNYHRISGGYTMVSGNVYATSVTAKAAGRDYLTLSNNVSSGTTIFNLTNGNVEVQESGVVSASTTSLGGGWYRCEMVAVGNASGAKSVFIGADNNGVIGTYTGDGISGVLIYQSQLESSLVATPYIETGATSAQAGILENTPRLDYSGGASCPSLLLEPQRSNFIPHSEYFGDWVLDGNGDGQSVTANYAISPEGVQNAYRLQLSFINGTYSRIKKSVTDSYSGAGVFSVYLKTNDGSTKTISMRWGGSGAVSKTITREWQRFDVSGTAIYTLAQDHELFIGSAEGDSDVVDLSIYAAMQETGSYATSYIPTYGVSQTRATDTYKKLGFGNTSTEGTLFIEFEASNLKSSNGMYMYGLAVGTTDLGTSYANSSGALSIIANGAKIQAMNNGYATNLFSFTPSVGEIAKIAIRYDGTNVVGFVNGVKQTTHTDNAVGVKNSIRVNNGEQSSHDTKQILFFPTALSDAELASLTTI